MVSELRSSVASIEKRLESPDALMSPQMVAEMKERRDMRSRRSRVLMMELRHMLHELQLEEKERPPNAKDSVKEMLMRIEHHIMTLDRDF